MIEPAAGLNPQRTAAARLWAAHHHPYLAAALFATELLEAPESGGVSVDEAWRVYVDPTHVEGWSAAQLGAELVHHTGHLLRDHATRARAVGLDQDELHHWVDAADAEIVDDLLPQVREVLDVATPDDLDSHEGRFAEEYFTTGAPRASGHRDCGSGAHGHDRAWDRPSDDGHGGDTGVSESEAELIRRKVASDIRDHERQEGGTPAGLLRWAESVLTPQVDWRRVLGAEVRRGLDTTMGAVDYSYARPSRRSSVMGSVVLPSLRQRTAEIVVVLDTSASMSDEILGQALTEVDGLLGSAGIRPDNVRVLTCDADVSAAQRVRSSQQVELVGGGGTDMAEGIEQAEGLRPRPDLIVVVTDGVTPWPEQPPQARVVVAVIGDGPPPPEWASMVRVT